MKLLMHLLSRIVIAAAMCLAVASAYVLHQSDVRAGQMTQVVATSLGRQLEFQLLRIEAGFGQPRLFPDFSLWHQTVNTPGICVRFESADSGVSRRLCHGANTTVRAWPDIFETVYRRLYRPDQAVARPIALHDKVAGFLTVTPSAELNIGRAWDAVRNLAGLTAITVLAVCGLVALTLSRALRPAGVIVEGLERLEQGNLGYRLPAFELLEWRRISVAVNQLAASQQQLLEQRRKLAIKLISLQEEERQHLSRELHDEFGQCLAAVNAVAASIAQTARHECPAITDEAEQIGRIGRHLLDGVHGMLARLRPAELDELGFNAGLKSLVLAWNGRGKTRYRLAVDGDCELLPKAFALTLYRIVQECLTNITRHAAAEHADVTLTIGAAAVHLTVRDDGVATALPSAENHGIGLLGIRERVEALHGRLALAIAEPHGFVVTVVLPIDEESH